MQSHLSFFADAQADLGFAACILTSAKYNTNIASTVAIWAEKPGQAVKTTSRSGSTPFANHPAVLDTSTASRMDFLKF